MVSKSHETLGAERIRASHRGPQGSETLGAERIRTSHTVSKCPKTLRPEHIRESHMVSKCHETLGAERIRASHKGPQGSENTHPTHQNNTKSTFSFSSWAFLSSEVRSGHGNPGKRIASDFLAGMATEFQVRGNAGAIKRHATMQE